MKSLLLFTQYLSKKFKGGKIMSREVKKKLSYFLGCVVFTAATIILVPKIVSVGSSFLYKINERLYSVT